MDDSVNNGYGNIVVKEKLIVVQAGCRGGSLAMESVAGLDWNTHIEESSR